MDVEVTNARHRVNGIELHVTEAGPEDGPLVVLLHGFPDAWWTWEAQLGPLVAQGFRVLIPDLRGYNRSDKPAGVAAYALDELVSDVIGLADAYERDTVRLVGHDWGGVIAYAAAMRHLERVERVVAMAAPHPHIPVRVALRRPSQAVRSLYVAFFQFPWAPEALLRAGDFALMRRGIVTSSRSGVFSPEELDFYVEVWNQPGALTAMLNYYRALRHYRRGNVRARLSVPTLVIWGGRDVALGEHLYRASLDLCGRGEGLFLHEASHWVHREEPDLIAETLTRFLLGDKPNGVRT